MDNPLIQEKLKALKNNIFPSQEDDSVEHIDTSYTNFLQWIDEVVEFAYEKGYTLGRDIKDLSND
jgi:hypothetical protein